MTKQQLRKIYKQKRNEIPALEKLKLDDLLLIQLQRLPLPVSFNVLMTYWPLEHLAEVNTHLLTRYLEVSIPNLQVAFPVLDFSTEEMHPVVVNEHTDFVENKYNIPEPEEGEQIEPDEIDVVLVPLLAFDKNGYRVGYGKGYYDRFLKKCKEDVITIGFSYFEAVDKIEDTHQFDVPLNYCITPHKIYEF